MLFRSAISWEDEGVVLSVRRFGEHDAIATLFTAAHGRMAGMVKGGSGKQARALLQPGNLVKAAWRARLDTQLGVYTLEGMRAFAAEAMDREPLELLNLEVEGLYCAGPAGGGGVRTRITPRLASASCLIERGRVRPSVSFVGEAP